MLTSTAQMRRPPRRATSWAATRAGGIPRAAPDPPAPAGGAGSPRAVPTSGQRGPETPGGIHPMSPVGAGGAGGERPVTAGGGGPPAGGSRLGIWALSLAASAFAVWTAVLIGQRWRQPAYAMPVAVVIVADACTLLTLTGAWLVARRGGSARSWLTVLATLLFLWGFLAIFSIGLGLLVAAMACLALRIRLGSRRPAARRRSRVGAGLILSLGLVPLSALAMDRPVVACTPGGSQTSVPLWMWFGGSSGSSGQVRGAVTAAGSNRSTGHLTVGGTTYAYSCAGGRLTRFRSSAG